MLESWGPDHGLLQRCRLPTRCIADGLMPTKAFSCDGYWEHAWDAAGSEGEPGLIGKATCVIMLQSMPTVTVVTE